MDESQELPECSKNWLCRRRLEWKNHVLEDQILQLKRDRDDLSDLSSLLVGRVQARARVERIATLAVVAVILTVGNYLPLIAVAPAIAAYAGLMIRRW